MRCVKVRKNAYDILRPPYNIRQYNFVCTGSGLRVHMPYHKIMNMLRRFRTETDPRFALSKRDETIPYIGTNVGTADGRQAGVDPQENSPGTRRPRAIVFITYAGYDFGPGEAEPAASLMALELEHIGFQYLGMFRPRCLEIGNLLYSSPLL